MLVLALWERLRPRQGRPRDRHTLEPKVVEPPVLEPSGATFSRTEFAPLTGSGHRTPSREPWIGEPGLAEAARLEDPPTVLIDDAVVVADESLDESPTAELPVLSESAVDIPADPSRPAEEPRFVDGVGPVRVIEAPSPESRAAMEPIVEWPPEESRHIVALRLVAAQERFSGRALRQALAAEGFLLGKFDIFHKSDGAHRAIVSAASLTRPGTFELATMDSQRYAGLNLFVVLPGPLPGDQAFDELVDAAHNLCERLQGELQDARGEELTGEGIEALRASLLGSASGGVA